MTDDNTDRLIQVERLRWLAGVSDATIHRWLNSDDPPIPAPVRVIGGRRYWSERAVLEALGLEAPDDQEVL